MISILGLLPHVSHFLQHVCVFVCSSVLCVLVCVNKDVCDCGVNMYVCVCVRVSVYVSLFVLLQAAWLLQPAPREREEPAV